MKKVLKITLIVAILLLCSITVTYATTNSELLAYVTKDFVIAGDTVRLSDADALKVKKYLDAYPVTSDEADKIIAKVDEAVALMEAAGVSDPYKLSKDQKNKLLTIFQEAAAIAGATITYNSADKTVDIYVDGVLFDQASSTSNKKYQQTGTDYAYIVYAIAGVAVVAVASVAIYRKKAGANA